MRPQSAISLGLAFGLAGAAAVLANRIVQPPAGASLQPERSAVVAAGLLPFGTPLTADNVKEITWPAHSVPAGSFASLKDLLEAGGRVTLATLQADEPILDGKITGPNQRATLSTLIGHGMRAVSVRVDEVRGVAGFILPGDRVDLILTRGETTGPTETAAYADLLLQNTKVLAIDQLVNERQDKPTVARAVTLEVDVEQAQKVILAQGVGKLSLILRQAGEAAPGPSRRVVASELGGYAPPTAAPQVVVRAEPPVVAFVAQPVVNVIRNAAKGEQYTVRSER